MFELWIAQEVPLGDFVAIFIFDLLALEVVEDGHGFLGLLLLFKLLVLLNDDVSVLQLLLMRLNVLSWEGNLSKAVEQRKHIVRS